MTEPSPSLTRDVSGFPSVRRARWSRKARLVMSFALVLGLGVISTLAAWNASVFLRSPFSWDASSLVPDPESEPGLEVSSSGRPGVWLQAPDAQVPADILGRPMFRATPLGTPGRFVQQSFQVRLNAAAVETGDHTVVELALNAADGEIAGAAGPEHVEIERMMASAVWWMPADSECGANPSGKYQRLVHGLFRSVRLSADDPQRTVCVESFLMVDPSQESIVGGKHGTAAFTLQLIASQVD